jgi:hypothetical protein
MQLFETLPASVPRKKRDKAAIYIIPLDGADTETPCRPV